MTVIGELIINFNQSAKEVVRSLEKLQKKLVHERNAVVFNQTCIINGLLPTYTNIRLHNPAIKKRSFTLEFRKQLVEEQLKEKKAEVSKLEDEQNDLQRQLIQEVEDSETRLRVYKALHDGYKYYSGVVRERIVKKLNHLYRGSICVSDGEDAFINLSSKELNEEQREFLNLGINCHLSEKFKPSEKNTNLELLYQDLTKLEGEDKIQISPHLRTLLLAEGAKRRGSRPNKTLTNRLREAAKSLRDDENIVVRRADKTAIYVILNKDDYLDKVGQVLSNEAKFEKVTRNTSADLQKKVNALITAANSQIDGVHFSKIIGEYKPGYLYGNVKIHKEGNPIRPIISQIPTPTYDIAKTLNQLITPYIPTHNILKSTDEFLTVLKCYEPRGLLASLDVQSLFTNVPVQTTIDIILKYVYENENIPAPKLSKGILSKLLLACTTEAPFRAPDGHLYRQVDGVAMGSPLGVLFANAYMCFVEDRVLQKMGTRPYIYKRYIDDIFIQIESETQLIELRDEFERNSVLKFTYEVGLNGKLPFLDFDLDISKGHLETGVYRKKTDGGRCLSALSECPARYKRGVIRAYVRRAFKYCSTWNLLDKELEHLKQMLANNCYPMADIDREIRTAFNEHMKTPTQHDKINESIVLYYRNQMTTAYREDEKALRDIISKNVTPTENKKIQLRIYYKNRRTANIVMKNNMRREPELQRTNVIYRWTCHNGDCKLQNREVDYIGRTSTTLSRRLTMHLHGHPPAEHTKEVHKKDITRQELVENTSIIASERSARRLAILEAVLIRERCPALNGQRDYVGIFTLCNTHSYGG